MPATNPQTWTRLTRIDLRRIANEIGNESMRMIKKWPKTGEGRAVKAATERIAERLSGPQPTKLLHYAYSDLLAVASELDNIYQNSFFNAEISGKTLGRRSLLAVPAGELVRHAIDEVRSFISQNPPPEPQPLELLQEIIPQDQKIGPAQFVFVDGFLRLNHSIDEPADRDKQNVERARAGLIEEGQWLFDNLSSSNADSRLISLVESMQARLKNSQDVIQLAVANISCQAVFSRFEDELPDVLVGRMQGYAISIGMFVGQFPEWVRFSENAALADYNMADVRAIHEAGQELIANLRDAEGAVDPEVPHTLAWMLEAINDPRKAARRAVFAAMRTIENLVVEVLRQCHSIWSSAATGVQKGVEWSLKGVVGIAIVTAAANVATRVSPVAGRVLQSTWLGKAGKIVLEAIDKPD